ncbi:ATP-binding cassette domain-containing protein [Enterococcus sp. BWM-S5]|uniref:ATP-binding cassette domain-containing protein n=1 Tax=Enterococcus larvae TaxID=2794352 RepID=A0ABS4CND2_9ENTE|nr:ATP-binding cassette domain-containing protein [Enterococcus larvae]MBP1047545.1 ATP-binding cassette domain-containing protein [Enterococcus larvae]
MNESMLTLKHVSKSFGKEQALKNVSLEVKKGDIYGLIGRNGSGKTTIMKLITDLSKESDGDIVLLGRSKKKSSYTQALQHIGAVIEEPVAYSKLSAYENMKIICIQKGIHDYSVIKEMLQFVNLADTGKKKFKNFSLGMKQRLGIAMALVNNPDFLILDEPINGLDPIAIIEFRELLERINNERNTTILISSHILTELYQVSTRFGFIHKGEMIQEITKTDFDALCTEDIIVHVNDINLASVTIREQLTKDFTAINEQELRIHDNSLVIAKVNRLLVTNGIDVSFIGKKEVSLENYYTNLVKEIGGAE